MIFPTFLPLTALSYHFISQGERNLTNSNNFNYDFHDEHSKICILSLISLLKVRPYFQLPNGYIYLQTLRDTKISMFKGEALVLNPNPVAPIMSSIMIKRIIIAQSSNRILAYIYDCFLYHNYPL